MRTLGPRWTRVYRPVRDGLSPVGLEVLAGLLVEPFGHGSDAYAYWSFDTSDPYADTSGNLGAFGTFRYSPIVALALAPLHALPWPVFITIWTLLLVAALAYLGGTWALALLALYPVALEVSYGNISLLLAAAIVVGFRWPAAWPFVLLTKVTPGVGLLWFVARREWRSVGIALGASVLLVMASWPFVSAEWRTWISVLAGASRVPDPGTFGFFPLWLRCAAGGTLVIFAARTDRRWLVPIAAGIAARSGQCLSLCRITSDGVAAISWSRPRTLQTHSRVRAADKGAIPGRCGQTLPVRASRPRRVPALSPMDSYRRRLRCAAGGTLWVAAGQRVPLAAWP